MYDLNRVRANTAYYLSQGRCPRCGGKQPVEPGLKRCSAASRNPRAERGGGNSWQRLDAAPAAGGHVRTRSSRPAAIAEDT